MTQWVTRGGAALLSVGMMAGCSPEADPEPSPSSSTTAEPTETVAEPKETPTPTETATPPTVEEQHIAEAEQTIRDYYAAVNRVASGGFSAWTEELIGFWGHPDVSTMYGSAFQNASDAGMRADGLTIIDSITAMEYTPDPGGGGTEKVRMGFCEDNSGVTTFSSDGSALPKGATDRFLWDVLMQHQADGRWTLNEMNPHPERSC